jgi:hypothetical protein
MASYSLGLICMPLNSGQSNALKIASIWLQIMSMTVKLLQGCGSKLQGTQAPFDCRISMTTVNFLRALGFYLGIKF